MTEIDKDRWLLVRSIEHRDTRSTLAAVNKYLLEGQVINAFNLTTGLLRRLEQDRCEYCASRPDSYDECCDQCIPF